MRLCLRCSTKLSGRPNYHFAHVVLPPLGPSVGVTKTSNYGRLYRGAKPPHYRHFKELPDLWRSWSCLPTPWQRTQKVTVEHVHVHAGGQAVVGLVEDAGEGTQ